MKAKHVLMAMSLPIAFAACTQDEFVDQSNAASNNLDRPTVGEVSVVLGETPKTRLFDPILGGGDNFDWNAGKLGACLMDEITNASGSGLAKYSLVNKVYTDYPFESVAGEDGGRTWKSTGYLLEGNYFFYYAQKAKPNMSRDGFKYTVAKEQVAYNDGENQYQPVTDNQLYISYQGFEGGKQFDGEEININLAPAHQELRLSVQYDGTDDIEIHSVEVIANKGDGFAVEGYLDVKDAAYTGIYPTYVAATGSKPASVNKTQEYTSANLPALFNQYNNDLVYPEVKGKAEFNPLTISGAIKGTDEKFSKSISVKLGEEGYDISNDADKTVAFTMIVPTNIVEDQTYTVKIYTDKGIVTYEEVGTKKYKKLEDGSIEEFEADEYEVEEGEEATEYVAEAKYYDANDTEGSNGWAANGAAVAEFKAQTTQAIQLIFKNGAIQVDKNFEVESTDKLALYLGYHDFQNYDDAEEDEEPVAIKATFVGDDIEMTPAIYTILKENAKKFRLTIAEDDENRDFTIAENVANNALYMVDWNGVDAVIAENAKQLINANFTQNITNYGELTVESRDEDGDAVSVNLGGNIVNEGKMTVVTPISSTTSIVNGIPSSTVNATRSTALLTVNANINNVTVNNYADVVSTAHNIGTIKNLVARVYSHTYRGSIYQKDDKTAKVTLNKSTYGNNDYWIEGSLYNDAIAVVNGKANFTTVVNTNDLDINAGASMLDLTNTGDIALAKGQTVLLGGSNGIKADGKTFVASAKITNEGTINVTEEFTNKGEFINNYALAANAGVVFTNNAKMTLGSESQYTYIASNEGGTIVLGARDLDLSVDTEQGTIEYTAVDTDFDGDAFASLPNDKFNKLIINKAGADLTALATADVNEADDITTVTDIDYQVATNSTLTFAADAEITSLTVGTDASKSSNPILKLYSKGLDITGLLHIRKSTTLQIPKNYSANHFGSVEIDSNGLLLVGGEFKSTHKAPASTNWQAAGTGVCEWSSSLAYDEFVKAIAAGGEVTLLSDITITEALKIEKDITINLNGKTISNTVSDTNGESCETSGKACAVFYINDENVELTIEGEGNVTADADDALYNIPVWVRNGKATINGGNFVSGADVNGGTSHAVYAMKTAVVNITGGTFQAEGDPTKNNANFAYVLNGYDKENAKIILSGGKFYQFNETNSRLVGEGEIVLLSEGYAWTEEADAEGYYSVVPAE